MNHLTQQLDESLKLYDEMRNKQCQCNTCNQTIRHFLISQFLSSWRKSVEDMKNRKAKVFSEPYTDERYEEDARNAALSSLITLYTKAIAYGETLLK